MSFPKNTGLGYYAMMHKNWPVKLSLSVFKELPNANLSILWNTFGKQKAGLKEFFKLDKPKLLQIHLINEVGHRNNRLGSYEVLYGIGVDEYRKKLEAKDAHLIKKLKRYAKEASDFLNKQAPLDTRLFISPGLESNLSPLAFSNLVAAIRDTFPPRCRWVWNPDNSNEFHHGPLDGFIHELHHSPANPKVPGIVNLDGEDISFYCRSAVLPNYIHISKLKRWALKNTQRRASFIWFAECNGIKKGSFVDPRSRAAFPTPQLIEELRKTLRE